jgi:hypothetical protein
VWTSVGYTYHVCIVASYKITAAYICVYVQYVGFDKLLKLQYTYIYTYVVMQGFVWEGVTGSEFYISPESMLCSGALSW